MNGAQGMRHPSYPRAARYCHSQQYYWFSGFEVRYLSYAMKFSGDQILSLLAGLQTSKRFA